MLSAFINVHFIPITGERSTTWLGFGWLMKKLDALLKALLMVVLLGEQVFLLLLVQAITNCCALCALPHNNFTTSPDIISPILLLSSPSLSSMKRLESTSSRRSYGFDHQFGRKFIAESLQAPKFSAQSAAHEPSK